MQKWFLVVIFILLSFCSIVSHTAINTLGDEVFITKNVQIIKPTYIRNDNTKEFQVQIEEVQLGELRQFIQNTNETYVPCSVNPLPYQYCQNHHLVLWDSISRNFSLYHKTTYVEDHIDFSIASHTSVNRLLYLSELEKRWSGPISLAIFTRFSQLEEVEKVFKQTKPKNLRAVLYIVEDSSQDCIYRSQWNETIHQNITACIPMDDVIYPINTLRNLAIQNIQTSHFLNMDMDMWPSYGLYEQLKNIQSTELMQERQALVLPAFQFTLKEREICAKMEDCLSVLKPKIPTSKSMLLSCMRKGVCQIANAFLPTHRFISDEWWKTELPIQQLECLPFKIMEPYALLRRTNRTVLYDDNFINYGYNKVQFIDHLHYKGYTFSVLTIGFGFDVPHKPSKYAAKYEESWKVKNVVNADVYQDFLQRLEMEESGERQPICNKEMALKVYRADF